MSLKLLVPIKRTPHRDSRIRIAADGALDTANLKYEVNPFDELAVEEALRIKESAEPFGGGELVVVTVGGEACHQQILAALAMGADRALRVDTDEPLDSAQIARCLAVVVERESPDLVLTGKLAYDDENGQVPAMLAEMLDWPQATQASSVEILDGGKRARVVCEVDSGLDEVELELPAVITADLRLNEPRYASLPGIMRAKRKPLDVMPLADAGDIGGGRARVLSYRELPPKPAGVRVESVDELIGKLQERKLL